MKRRPIVSDRIFRHLLLTLVLLASLLPGVAFSFKLGIIPSGPSIGILTNLSVDQPDFYLTSRIPSPSRLEPRTSLTHFSSPIVRKISSPHPISVTRSPRTAVASTTASTDTGTLTSNSHVQTKKRRREKATGLGKIRPVLHALQQTASRAAPPGSTRRSLVKKFARGVLFLPPLFLGGALNIAAPSGAMAIAPAGVAAVDKTPGRYKNVAMGSMVEPRPRSASGVDERVKQEVLQTTQEWLQTVTSNRATASAETAALYASDAVLWGTVSEELRVNPAEIRSYFDFFAALPGLRVAAYQPYVRIFGTGNEGETAINDGYYVFAWRGPDGREVQKHARYSFVYRKEGGKWMIVDHHSSLLPTAPAGLAKATTVVM